MFLHRVQLHLRCPRHILIKFNLKATTFVSSLSAVDLRWWSWGLRACCYHRDWVPHKSTIRLN